MLGVGAYEVVQGRMSAGELVVIMSYIASVYLPLESLSDDLTSLQQSTISFEHCLQILDTPVEVTEKPDAIELHEVRGNLAFENVAFDYSTRPGTLKGVSFRVGGGQAFAIIGPTGAGKSTLASLMPRFYDPQQGQVFIDGRDVRDVTLESLRRQFAIVLQEPLLFEGTIADNILYGKPDATVEQIVAAAMAANAHDFIMGLPRKYDTTVGEGGTKISGGERQRICVARAFLRDAPILILDEPTSSIDSRTEGVILEASDRLGPRGGRPSQSLIGFPPYATPIRSWSSTAARSSKRGLTTTFSDKKDCTANCGRLRMAIPWRWAADMTGGAAR